MRAAPAFLGKVAENKLEATQERFDFTLRLFGPSLLSCVALEVIGTKHGTRQLPSQHCTRHATPQPLPYLLRVDGLGENSPRKQLLDWCIEFKNKTRDKHLSAKQSLHPDLPQPAKAFSVPGDKCRSFTSTQKEKACPFSPCLSQLGMHFYAHWTCHSSHVNTCHIIASMTSVSCTATCTRVPGCKCALQAKGS